MKIATWNVNSVRTRLDRLLNWLDQHQPDVLCLQEIKCREDDFPFEPIEQMGYFAEVAGQKAYNGIALLSRKLLTDVKVGIGHEELDNQARVISATLDDMRIISVYVPNGCDMSTEKYPYKKRWLNEFRRYLNSNYSPSQKLVVCGDTNVILEDIDAADMSYWKNTGIGCEEIREKFSEVTSWGLTDIFRKFYTETGHYSWWSYRHSAFDKNRGLRIDHILGTQSACENCTSITIDKEQRAGISPSDHAPVVAIFK